MEYNIQGQIELRLVAIERKSRKDFFFFFFNYLHAINNIIITFSKNIYIYIFREFQHVALNPKSLIQLLKTLSV